MLPTLHKQLFAAASVALVALLAAAPASAASAPRIKAVYAVDADRDGRVDAAALTWSGKVRGGRDRKAPFALSVPGYRIARIDAARGKSQRVRLVEKAACDIGGAMRVAYSPRRGAATVRAARGRRTPRRHRVDMRRFDPPTPRITCAVTRDRDSDGHVDGIRLTYSRTVKSRAQSGGRFLFSVAGYRVTGVAAAKGRFLDIAVAEKPAPDSGSAPAIGYSRPAGKRQRPFAVRSGRRALAFAGTFQGTRDGVSPRLISGRTADGNGNGLLDAMTLRFSEPVQASSPGAISVLGMHVRSLAGGANGAITASLVEGRARTDARPGASVAGPGVTDTAGNAALPGAISPADGAGPVFVGAMTEDVGGKPGHIDAVTVGFSEPVVHLPDASGTYPFTVADRHVTSVDSASGRTIRVRVAESGRPDSGSQPHVRYMPGVGRTVTDTAGNPASEGVTTAIDGVAPALVSATTADASSNGRIDRISLRFSEPVVHGAETGQSSFTVAGYGVTGAAEADGASVDLTLRESSAPDTGARPAVAYRRDGVEDVRDAIGNLAGDTSIAQAGDGARPVLVSVATADADSDGRIDRLATTWSEPLAHADNASAPFPLTASGFTVKRVHGAAGSSLAVDLAEPSHYDTGSTPTLAYQGGAKPIRDAAGLEPAKRSWPGLTRDALAPRLVGAATADDNGDGSLDAVKLKFSENVVHARETAQGSFTVTGRTILSAEAASGSTIALRLEQSGTGDTGLRPAVAYAPDGQEDVRDAAANFAEGAAIAQAADGARPVLLSAATGDADDDGRLDRVATSWSEPLVHADDTSAPFPIAAAGFAVTRVHAAVGQSLEISLEEPAAHDTGSAPDLTYGGEGEPIRDAAGLEPADRSYGGLTRDALAPRYVRSTTLDADTDGKLDRVEIVWSEPLTGSTGTGPFAVDGRSLGASITFSGSSTRIPFAENPSAFDTHEVPPVSYDPTAGDLRDVPKGPGDTADPAPAIAGATPRDGAAPILVAAKTADLVTPGVDSSPNGTIDAVLVTFSEPITHTLDTSAPFALNVAGRSETQVEGHTGESDRTLYVSVNEAGSPDGGETPNVSVVAAGAAGERIRDRAAEANEARVMTFSATADEVSPVLMSSQLGERGGDGECVKASVPGIDGRIDCVLTTWSEDVEHADDSTSPFSIGSSGWSIPGGGIGRLGPAKTVAVPLAPGTEPDRDRAGTSVSYTRGIETPFVDAAPAANEALAGTRSAEPACRDTGREASDVIDPGNELLRLAKTSPAFERKCAFDDDWFNVTPGPGGYVEVSTRPVAGIDIELELRRADGALVTPDASEAGGTGQVDRLTFEALPPGDYWARVTADDGDPAKAPQEGPYCIVYSDDADVPSSCGPLAGQIVFTEVGFGNDKFIEIKNDFDVPVDMSGANAKIVIGAGGTQRECPLVLPTGSGESMIDPDEHVLVQNSPTATAFGCNQISSLAPTGERLELSANGAIDSVPLAGIVNSPVAANHSLQFVESSEDEDHQANDNVAGRWCRTFDTHSKGEAGDGCDEYRINEVLWKPTSSPANSDGRYFVELAGNIPALSGSGLLGGWILRGVNAVNGDGTEDYVLPAGTSPRANGTYVIADGLPNGSTHVSPSDRVWIGLDLNSSAWPEGASSFGPRGLQLLTPAASGSAPCFGAADAFGWDETGQSGFVFDDRRGCPTVEGLHYTDITPAASAARDNLESTSHTTYNVNRDTDRNRADFCKQTTPNPGALNVRPACGPS